MVTNLARQAIIMIFERCRQTAAWAYRSPDFSLVFQSVGSMPPPPRVGSRLGRWSPQPSPPRLRSTSPWFSIIVSLSFRHSGTPFVGRNRLIPNMHVLSRAHLLGFEHRADHQRYGNDRQGGVFHLPCQWQGLFLGDHVKVVRIVNQFPDPHSFHLVLEQFATVEAHNIPLTMFLSHIHNRRYAPGNTP